MNNDSQVNYDNILAQLKNIISLCSNVDNNNIIEINKLLEGAFEYFNLQNKYFATKMDLLDQQLQYFSKRCEFLEEKQTVLIDHLIKENNDQPLKYENTTNESNESSNSPLKSNFLNHLTLTRPSISRSDNKRIKMKRESSNYDNTNDTNLLEIFHDLINPTSSKNKIEPENITIKEIQSSNILHDNLEFIECDFKFNKLEDLLQIIDLANIIKEEHSNYNCQYEMGEYKDYYLYYDKKYGINFKKLENIKSALLKLINIIGMNDIKVKMLDVIASRLCPGYNDSEPLHTLIMGNPGLGKTKVCKIITAIYCGLGLASKDKIVYAKRSQLVGKHLGHTAPQTQKLIDNAMGGILVIDEAYALGDEKSNDSFSKECIDTIVQNMSENKKKFIMIMIGYENSIKNNLFSNNQGLESRFCTDTRFIINDYTATELAQIFLNNINKHQFILCNEQSIISNEFIKKLFIENYDYFPGFGRSVKDYFNNCKRVHYRNLLGKNPSQIRNMLSIKTIKECMKTIKNINASSFVSNYHR